MTAPRALCRRRGPGPLRLAAVVTLWFSVARVSSGSNGAPQNLKCFKACCTRSSGCLPKCSWAAGDQAGGVIYTLHFRYHNHLLSESHVSFEAGNATSLVLGRYSVYNNEVVTVWVESQAGEDSPPLRSENLTLVISQAIKLKAPSNISFSRSNGRLALSWSESNSCRQFPWLKEVRMRPALQTNWTLGVGLDDRWGSPPALQFYDCTDNSGGLRNPEFPASVLPPPGSCLKSLSYGNCETQDPRTATVSCLLEGNSPYEVQVRHRMSDRYSDWSDWSESVEILRSPELNCSAEPLREDGLRKVTLKWEKAGRQQGEVTYTLTFLLLACPCLAESVTFSRARNTTSFQGFLSGAAYNISLQAANRAGRPPAASCRLPAEKDAGPAFQKVVLSDRNFTVTWGTEHEVICFENTPRDVTPPGRSCEGRVQRASATNQSTGVLESGVCSRLAVHRWDPVKYTWVTLGLVHLLPRSAFAEDAPRLDVGPPTATSAEVRWDPPDLLSTCPGVLKKYIVCWQDEQGKRKATYEANATETCFTISGLQPNTTYRVGVRAVTLGSEGPCGAHVPFRTRLADPKKTALTLSFLLLGLVGGVFVAASAVHLCRKRVKEVLCPPLPDPADTEAVNILTGEEPGRAPPRRGFMQPLEAGSPTEPLVVEPRSTSKEEAVSGTTVDFLAPAKPGEETPLPKDDPLGSGDLLPSEYKGQSFLCGRLQ